MNELILWRNRHKALKIELLKLSKRIEDADQDDILFYQEICEKYAYHLKNIEATCHSKLGVRICNCGFNPELCIK